CRTSRCARRRRRAAPLPDLARSRALRQRRSSAASAAAATEAGVARTSDAVQDGRKRCPWAERSPHELAYHDEEWGVPVRDDRRLFEFLILEGAQAGLSWSTILGRRDGYRRAFAGFDPARVARFGSKDVERLLADPGIIRNRLKVEAA